ALYWLLPRRATVQNVVLVAASLFFYATWSLRLLPLFIVSTLIDYAVLRGFARTQPPADEAPHAERAAASHRGGPLLAVGLVNNRAAVIFFKYVGFAADSLNHALGTHIYVLKLALPLGISFYTMGRMGVLLDTYYDRITPVRSLLVWFSFVSFF